MGEKDLIAGGGPPLFIPLRRPPSSVRPPRNSIEALRSIVDPPLYFRHPCRQSRIPDRMWQIPAREYVPSDKTWLCVFSRIPHHGAVEKVAYPLLCQRSRGGGEMPKIQRSVLNPMPLPLSSLTAQLTTKLPIAIAADPSRHRILDHDARFLCRLPSIPGASYGMPSCQHPISISHLPHHLLVCAVSSLLADLHIRHVRAVV